MKKTYAENLVATIIYKRRITKRVDQRLRRYVNRSIKNGLELTKLFMTIPVKKNKKERDKLTRNTKEITGKQEVKKPGGLVDKYELHEDQVERVKGTIGHRFDV